MFLSWHRVKIRCFFMFFVLFYTFFYFFYTKSCMVLWNVLYLIYQYDTKQHKNKHHGKSKF